VIFIANENVEALRQKYMKDVPLGFTAEEIQKMSDDDILDMDYFLNEYFLISFIHLFFVPFFTLILSQFPIK